MKTLENIIGKTACWGTHTFIATQNHHSEVRIDVYRNTPYKLENFYFFKIDNPAQIEKESLDETSSLRFYTGKLQTWNEISRLEEFLNSFKHITK